MEGLGRGPAAAWAVEMEQAADVGAGHELGVTVLEGVELGAPIRPDSSGYSTENAPPKPQHSSPRSTGHSSSPPTARSSDSLDRARRPRRALAGPAEPELAQAVTAQGRDAREARPTSVRFRTRTMNSPSS